MRTYDDFSRPTTDTTMISPSDAGIHSESAIAEYLMKWEDGPAVKAINEGRPLEIDEVDFDYDGPPDGDAWSGGFAKNH